MNTALIIGGGACVWDDLDALEAMVGRWRGPVFAVNDAACRRDVNGRCWTRKIDHFCTLHAEKVARWKQERRKLVLSLGRSTEWDYFETWSCTKRTPVDHHFSGNTKGSSGLYAVSVAFHLGHPRVVLCGVPMDNRRNAFRDETEWKAYRRYTDAWVDRARNARPEFVDRIRSMSGWTREKFGAPTPEWIRGEAMAA